MTTSEAAVVITGGSSSGDYNNYFHTLIPVFSVLDNFINVTNSVYEQNIFPKFQFLVDRHEEKAFWQKKHVLDTILLCQKFHNKSALLQLIIVIYANDKQKVSHKKHNIFFH